MAGRGKLPAGPATLRVMTFNIRYDGPPLAGILGAPDWAARREAVLVTIREADPDLLGLQEVTLGQLRDLAAGLPAYDWVGRGRDDGHEAGEFTPIFFRRDRLALIDSDTFWLSDTPESPGDPAWGARLRRITTWARLRAGRRTWWLFNTHFDHESPLARHNSARLLLERVGAAGPRLLVTGDLNSTPRMATYRLLTAPGSGLFDARRRSARRHEGAGRTFHPLFDGRAIARIDYVLVGAAVDVLRHRALDAPVNGLYPSDHFPLVVDCRA